MRCILSVANCLNHLSVCGAMIQTGPTCPRITVFQVQGLALCILVQEYIIGDPELKVYYRCDPVLDL